jgi:hypothetical protein
MGITSAMNDVLGDVCMSQTRSVSESDWNLEVFSG